MDQIRTSVMVRLLLLLINRDFSELTFVNNITGENSYFCGFGSVDVTKSERFLKILFILCFIYVYAYNI